MGAPFVKFPAGYHIKVFFFTNINSLFYLFNEYTSIILTGYCVDAMAMPVPQKTGDSLHHTEPERELSQQARHIMWGCSLLGLYTLDPLTLAWGQTEEAVQKSVGL